MSYEDEICDECEKPFTECDCVEEDDLYPLPPSKPILPPDDIEEEELPF